MSQRLHTLLCTTAEGKGFRTPLVSALEQVHVQSSFCSAVFSAYMYTSTSNYIHDLWNLLYVFKLLGKVPVETYAIVTVFVQMLT